MLLGAIENPYWGKNFFNFFITLFHRIFLFFTGKLNFSELATDETQLLILAMLSVSCGVLGSFLLLRKMTMLANSLSHTILIGIVLTFFIFQKTGSDFRQINLSMMLVASFVSALITTFFTQFLTRRLNLQKDASIGLVFTFLFALGILFVTVLTRSSHIGSEVVMGNVDALHPNDLKTTFVVMLINLSCISFFSRGLKVSTFDPVFAKTLGISCAFFHYLLMLLTSLTCIASFRAVGVVLVLAFLVSPYLTARILSHDLKKILVLSPLLGFFCSLVGVALSRHLLSFHSIAVSTGSLVVLLISIQFLTVFFIRILKNRKQATLGASKKIEKSVS